MDNHDLGLQHDLDVLRARWSRVDRRGALRLLGAAGAGLVLVACGNDKGDNGAAVTTSTSAATGAATTAASGAVTRAPQETGGPYPADGTNGPNVLTDTGIIRRDITKSFGKYSGTATGVPLKINLTVVHAATGAPYAGAAVYLWHCTAEGGYTLYSQGFTDQNYLRGVQNADDAGKITFESVFPACYDGRWPHIHYEVFPSLTAAGSASNRLVTSQIALPQAQCEAAYADAAKYPSSAGNLSRVSLQSDMVFADSYQNEMADVAGTPSSGYTLNFKIAV